MDFGLGAWFIGQLVCEPQTGLSQSVPVSSADLLSAILEIPTVTPFKLRQPQRLTTFAARELGIH